MKTSVLALAAVAVMALTACDGSTTAATTTTPATTSTASTAAPPATTTAVPIASTLPPTTAQVVQGIEELDHFAPFEPGARYSLDPDADPSTAMRVVYKIPAEGWTRWDGAAKFADDGHVAVTITTVLNLVRHGCLDHSRVDPPVGPSVDDLATALTELPPFLVTSPPKNVSISGYQGKHLELTVPDLPADHEGDAPFTECLDGSLKSWVAPFDDEAPDAFYGYTGPGYVEEFWLLDVDGTRLMIAAERSAGSPPAHIAEMREILDSIRIEPGGFPTGVFAGLDEEPVSVELAAELQGLVDSWAEGEQGGLTATLITPAGTWSGAAGAAAGDRAMTPNDQMAIASVTKTVLAAQVMQLVEAGELRLGDLAADRLPADLKFDTNGATIDDLLSMRSGIPDWVDPVFWESLSTDPLHAWTAEEVLALVGPERTPVGQAWNYSSTNYALLGLIVEHVTGRTLAEVLRDGVLAGGEYERMIYQPDEQPSEPMAMPFAAADAFGAGGGYLPSVAGATSAGPAGAMAADSLTVARWWRALCAGEIVSVASFHEMTDFLERPEYGLGIAEMSEEDGRGAVGHGGSHVGFKSWALCLPEFGVVVVALTNSERDSIHDLAAALARATSE